jgi:hypothetical protein
MGKKERFADIERMRRGVAMLALIVESEADFRAGRTIPQDRVFDQVLKRLEAKKQQIRTPGEMHP